MRDGQQAGRIAGCITERLGCQPEHLWARFPHYAVFRHPASRKWFAVLMEVSRDRLGLAGEGVEEILDIKCSPLMTGSLLAEWGFLPAYHMDKSHWVTVLLDGTVPDDAIRSLLELAYDSVAPRRRRKTAP